MYSTSGVQVGFYGDLTPENGATTPFDADARYRLDIDDGGSMTVQMMSSPGAGSIVGEAVFRTRGAPLLRTAASEGVVPTAVLLAAFFRPGSTGFGRMANG
jgi:hypothetical protein